MKLLFIFHGTTHYFNLITSRINQQPGIDITYVYPKRVSSSMGDGVYQTTEGANFKLVELEEATNKEHGYDYFVNLEKFITDTKPDIILCSDIHLKSLFYDERLKAVLRKLNIKVILKTIPFQLSTYESVEAQFKAKQAALPLPPFHSFPPVLKKILKLFRIDVMYKKLYMDRKENKRFYLSMKRKKELFNFPDAHVNYIEDAYSIYGSYGVPKEKIFITYNSPDTDFLFSVKEKVVQALPLLPKNEFRIVHVSRLVEWKRVDMLIEATKNLKRNFPELELLVIGDGPEKQKLVKQAHDLGVEADVKFLGAVYDPEHLGNYLMGSSIYILAGMGGLSINDAMIFGLPVICSVCDGTEKYLVRENYNGLYFNNGDQDSLESKIKILLDDRAKRKEMGNNSVKIINDEINIHTVINGYLNAFNYVLRK